MWEGERLFKQKIKRNCLLSRCDPCLLFVDNKSDISEPVNTNECSIYVTPYMYNMMFNKTMVFWYYELVYNMLTKTASKINTHVATWLLLFSST